MADAAGAYLPTKTRPQASLQRVLLLLSAVETLDRAQHDCLQKYGLTALTKIKKIAPSGSPLRGREVRRGEGDGQKLSKIKENYH